MQITEVNVRRLFNDETPMKAVVSITFDGCFAVHDIKVIEGQKGIFVAMPNRKMGDGEFKDVAHPIQQFMRDMIRDAVLAEYKKKAKEE